MNLPVTILSVLLILVVWLLTDTKKDKNVKLAIVFSAAIVIAHALIIFDI